MQPQTIWCCNSTDFDSNSLYINCCFLEVVPKSATLELTRVKYWPNLYLTFCRLLLNILFFSIMHIFKELAWPFLLCQLTHIFFSWALIENMKLSVMTEETSVSDRIPERPQSPASSASSSDWAPRTSISPGTFLRSFPVVFVSFLQWSCY